jgi:DNA polymerase-3 subunit chi
LERALARSWRSVVQLGDAARVAVVDDYLWTFRDDSFLPHARAGEGEATHQPVWLTDGDDNPNGAALRVLMDGVDPAAAAHDPCYQRVLILFDGQDESLVAQARQAWQGLRETAAGELSYWQQDEDGQFQKKYSRAARDSGGTAGPAAAPATDIDTGDMT